MRNIVFFLLLPLLCFGQTTNYPAALDTDTSLFVTADNQQSYLTVAMAIGDSVAVVASGTGFAANQIVTICDTQLTSGPMSGKCTAWEHMRVTSVNGNQLTVTRGVNGTSARAHAANKPVSVLIDSAHQKVLKDAVIAIETALGANLSNIPASPLVVSTTYNFSAQTPGGSLISGNNTITLTPCPLGVNGSNTNHYLYVSGGTGTAEAALITGGSCTSGATTGTIILNTANTHSGAWTVQSATAGIAEAIRSTSGPVGVVIPNGTYNIYGSIVIDKDSVRVEGLGSGGTIAQAGDPPSSPTTSVKLVWQGAAYGTVIKLLPATNSIRKDITLRNFSIDGSSVLYATGIWAKALTGSLIEDVNLWSPAPDDTTTLGAIYLTSGDGGSGSNRNVSENVFRRIAIRQYGSATRPDSANMGACWYFDQGGNASSDISRNLFIGIRNWFAGTAGIMAKNSDSNTFIDYEAFGIAGSGYGYRIPATGIFAGGHLFFHFNGTYRADFGTNLDRIFLAVDNTNPADVITVSNGSGAVLVEGKNNTSGTVRQLIRAATGTGSAMTDNNWGPLIMTGSASFTGAVTSQKRANYIASETGANNAIAGALVDAAGTAVPLTNGLTVTVKLAHTLQAGANTFNLNGGGAVAIKSARNAANNIGTAYAATGTVTLLYDSTGPYWLDVSQ